MYEFVDYAGEGKGLLYFIGFELNGLVLVEKLLIVIDFKLSLIKMYFVYLCDSESLALYFWIGVRTLLLEVKKIVEFEVRR